MRSNTIRKSVSVIVGIILLTGCATHYQLPEGERFYGGIRKLAYDKPIREEEADTAETTGVITALSDAYNTVESVLTGNMAKPLTPQGEAQTEKQRRDSLRQRDKRDMEAYAKAKEEVEAILSYPPNGAVLGSSSARWPWRPKMWIYKRYVHAESGFGKWMFNHFAAHPVFVSTVNPEVRRQVAVNTLQNYGYFRGRTQYECIQQKDTTEDKINYTVCPGELFHLY